MNKNTDELYVEDLEKARRTIGVLAKHTKNPVNVTGVATFTIENASLEEIAEKYAEIQRLFRLLLWNDKSNSDILNVDFFFKTMIGGGGIQ